MILGGARSGKSSEAERRLTRLADGWDGGDGSGGGGAIYVATGGRREGDADWAERVRRHQERRPASWTSVETTDVASVLRAAERPVLVDCLTLWLTRVLDRHAAWDDAAWSSSAEKAVADDVELLVAAWRATRRRVVAVSNEVGQGVVPATSSGRRFRDLMGRLNARIASETEDVLWCEAGRVSRL